MRVTVERDQSRVVRGDEKARGGREGKRIKLTPCRTIELFFRLKTPQLERYQVFLLRNRPARVFLTQHELVGSRHRTITFLEEYPDFPLCFFSSWIKTVCSPL